MFFVSIVIGYLLFGPILRYNRRHLAEGKGLPHLFNITLGLTLGIAAALVAVLIGAMGE